MASFPTLVPCNPNRVSTFQQETGTDKNILVTLITVKPVKENALWKKTLTDAVATGEIGPQQDLDTVAATFQSLFYGYSYHASIGKVFDPSALKAQMMGFYQSLCK